MLTRSPERPPAKHYLSWVLVIALLLAQSLALAHDHDADAGPEGTCALCLFAHHVDGSLPAASLALQTENPTVFNPMPADSHFTGSARPHYRSRAPPAAFL
jgi:hypothetical protein